MAQENSSHVAICDKCKGNGFIRISKDSFSKVKQCKHCNSEGVMRIDEPAIEELEQMADIARLQWEESVAFANYKRKNNE